MIPVLLSSDNRVHIGVQYDVCTYITCAISVHMLSMLSLRVCALPYTTTHCYSLVTKGETYRLIPLHKGAIPAHYGVLRGIWTLVAWGPESSEGRYPLVSSLGIKVLIIREQDGRST